MSCRRPDRVAARDERERDGEHECEILFTGFPDGKFG
jgi:hypothetical protein